MTYPLLFLCMHGEDGMLTGTALFIYLFFTILKKLKCLLMMKNQYIYNAELSEKYTKSPRERKQKLYILKL